MDLSRMDETIAKLNEKGVILSCPRCGKTNFSFIGESLLPIENNPRNRSITGGPTFIPTVIVACDNCGFIAQHAKGPLGLRGATK